LIQLLIVESKQARVGDTFEIAFCKGTIYRFLGIDRNHNKKQTPSSAYPDGVLKTFVVKFNP
jgi:hypothetical protein